MARLTSPPRALLALLLGTLFWIPRGAVAQSPEDRANMSEDEVCPLHRVEPPLEPSTEQERRAYRSMRSAAADARRRCVIVLRAERDKPRRAAHAKPRYGLTLGYDGALLFRWREGARYRAPSAQLGALFRRNYRPIVGLHVLLAVNLGNGRFGASGSSAAPDFGSKRVGPSLDAISEVGLLLGPGVGTRVYGLVTSQLRLVVPGAKKKTFVFDDRDGVDRVTVEWPRPTTCLGIRGGLGLMFGKLHQGFIEASGGGGALLNPWGGGFITVTAKAGWLFRS